MGTDLLIQSGEHIDQLADPSKKPFGKKPFNKNKGRRPQGNKKFNQKPNQKPNPKPSRKSEQAAPKASRTGRAYSEQKSEV